MTFLDLFAGMGGFRLALERAGFKCAGYVETDKFAKKTYEANFDTKGEWTGEDITKITEREISALRKKRRIDVICAGFPCQAFSIAGKRQGFCDPRGRLFFDLCRFIRVIRPGHFILENVKGLLSHDAGRTFLKILHPLAKLGYALEWQVLNAKNFGLAQNRERVIIVGHLGKGRAGKILPVRGENGPALKELIGGRQSSRVYDPAGAAVTLAANGGGFAVGTGLYLISSASGGIKLNDTAICLTASYGKGLGANQGRPGVLEAAKGRAAACGGINPSFIGGGTARIRKLTPLECFRLQGFPDSHYEKARAAGLSDAQLYKQAGNAVAVPIIYAVAKRLAQIRLK